MKKFFSIALCALMAASMAVSAFADDSYATIKNITAPAFEKEGFEPECGIDGDMDTRFSITVDSDDGVYAVVELDNLYTVNGISVSLFKGDLRNYDIELYVSTDGENWTVAAERDTTEEVAEAQGFNTIAFDKAYDAKYVKIHCWGKIDIDDGIYDGGPDETGAAQAWFSFWEMKVLGTVSANATTTTTDTTTDTAPATMDVSLVLAGVAAASAAVAAVSRKKK